MIKISETAVLFESIFCRNADSSVERFLIILFRFDGQQYDLCQVIYYEIIINLGGSNFRGFRGSLKPRKLKSNKIQFDCFL
jgi:hypothetical protein